MKGQYLPKPKNLSQVALKSVSSLPPEQYFMRYLSFQNELVMKVNLDIKE